MFGCRSQRRLRQHTVPCSSRCGLDPLKLHHYHEDLATYWLVKLLQGATKRGRVAVLH